MTENAQCTTEIDRSDLPRAACACGWTWDALDAVEDGEKTPGRVRSRLSSMAEGHAYFNREGGHVIDTIRKDLVDEELVESLQEVTG